MRIKQAENVAEITVDIYKVGPLTYQYIPRYFNATMVVSSKER